jgi:tetratricopeptide (TPR) repeat protein
MSSSDWPDIERVLATLIELPKDERSARIAQLCAHNSELRAEVESLLAAHESAESFMQTGSLLQPDSFRLAVADDVDGSHVVGSGVPSPWPEMKAALPTRIGHYRIIRLLAEGGMGYVYEAEQEQPCRTVALKVIRPGMTSPEMLRRFEREFQTLGRLQHPGIAQIYEAGSADSGFGAQPYIAMEFIKGSTLLEYAGAQRLDTRERLELMVKVCDAVHHAHQRRVIHRDLKPGNILVDETGQPKILDLGIARLTNCDEQRTRQTDLGQLLGTLAYMSPEQVLADPSQLDPRTDVYSLGVILFELLAGHPPYALSRRLDEAVHTIREEDPKALSSINRTYRGDIEIIVARALEKDKARRYFSAAELGSDIQRYLKDQPILARRASTAYQIHKFARRHRALVLGMVSVFAVLVAGIIASTWEATRARHAEQMALLERDRAARAERGATAERDRALAAEQTASTEKDRSVAAETRAVRERNRARSEAKRADTESATARAINDFLQNDVLAQASARVQAGPNQKPDPDLKVRTALDRAAANISGKFKQPLVEASIRQTLGNTYNDLGLYSDAQEQLQRALDLRRSTHGEVHDDLDIMNSLAFIYDQQGKYPQTEQLLLKSIEIERRLLGENHPDTLGSINNLGLLYRHEGKFVLAEPLLTKVVELRRKVQGEEHPETLICLNNLGSLYRDEGKYAQAELLLSKSFDVQRRVSGEDHPETLTALGNLGVLYRAEGKHAQAEPILIEVLEKRRRLLGQEHPYTLMSMYHLGLLYLKMGKYGEAEPLLVKVLEVRRRLSGSENPFTMMAVASLGKLRLEQQRDTEAESLLREALDGQQKGNPDGWERYESQSMLAVSLAAQSKFAEAEPLLLGAYRGLLERQATIPFENRPLLEESGQRIVRMYREWGKPEQAAFWEQQLQAVPPNRVP